MPSNSNFVNYFEVLELSDYLCLMQDVKNNYLRLAHKYHPDKNGGSNNDFLMLKEAYDVLFDFDKRAEYFLCNIREFEFERNYLIEDNVKKTVFHLEPEKTGLGTRQNPYVTGSYEFKEMIDGIVICYIKDKERSRTLTRIINTLTKINSEIE